VGNKVVLFFFTIISSLIFFSEAACGRDKPDQPRKQDVEDFFLNLFSREFGYTLIGVKPISIDEVEGKYYQEIGFSQEIDDYCFDELRKAFEGSSNFVLKIFSDGPCHSVELINRRAVRQLVQRNLVLQSFIKKRFKSDEDFYSQIEDPDRSFFKTLRNNDKIIGYLLGYDETNIEYYIRRIEVGLYLQKYPFVRYHPLPGGIYSHNPFVFLNPHLFYKRLQPSQGFDSLESEWRWIRGVAWDIEEESQPIPPHFVSMPVYICRHGGDSELTREKYKKARDKLANLFCGRKISEIITEEAVKK
jgi:hypothetical protein